MIKTKEQILEEYFGSDYWLLAKTDDLPYILRAMDAYADQFKQPSAECTKNGGIFTCVKCGDMHKID